MTTQTTAQKFYAAGEVATATRLLRFVLSKGLSVSVWEGEGWAIKRSTSLPDLLDAIASTGEDTLSLFPAGEKTSRIGVIYLVWGNADDGSELVADHSDNEAINSLISEGGF